MANEIEAMLVSRSLNYKGTIIDITDNGLCISISAESNLCQLMNGMLFGVRFTLPSGEDIDLQCEVVRTHRDQEGPPENIVGMKIIDQPPEYPEFLKTLR